MTLQIISNGDKPSGTQWMNNHNEALTLSLYSLCRQLEDRAVTFSAGQTDAWGEAYTDSNGRLDAVTAAVRDASGQITSGSTALFSSTKYVCTSQDLTNVASSGTTHDPDSVTSPSNFFDNNSGTSATKTAGSGFTSQLGKTFAATDIMFAYVRASCSMSGSGNNYSITLEKYNGATWSSVATLASGTSVGAGPFTYTGLTTVNANIQGLRVKIVTSTGGSTTHTYTELGYGNPSTTYTTVVHTIPSGTFAATVSKAILAPKIVDWETGADIQYKLTNAGQDSGWLSAGNTPVISSFTAFTSEPTTLTVKLIPKSSSPTAGYPSISAVALRATP